jgi:hypothetical protein
MKKFILSALSLMMALTMSAITYQAQVSITLDDGTYLPALVVGESSDLAAGVNNGYAGEIQNLDEMPLAIYAIYGGVKYSTFSTKSYTNLPVGIKTTEATTYHLYFDDVTGTVNLYDKKTGAPVPVTEGGDYEFTISNEEKNSLLNDRFYINYDPTAYVTTVTTNAYGYASFSYTEDLKLASAGAKLYTGTISGETLNMTEVDYVKAGEGVIVKGAANTTYNLVAGTGSSVYGANALIASANWTAATEDAYFLVGNEFKKYIGTEVVPAGKAYLIYTAGGANPAPRRIVMRFNTTTAVENVEAEAVQPVKFIENGEIFIRRGNEVYNLQGQLVK